jgi:cysteine desulfurase
MKINFRKQSSVYLDYASTTPVSKEVILAMNKFWTKHFHNPNGLYQASVDSHNYIEGFRKKIASHFDVRAQEVVFTSGGTESDNLAIQGVVYAFLKNNKTVTPHVIVSSIEHPAVLECVTNLEKQKKIQVSVIPVLGSGVIDISALKKEITKKTILVSVMHVNNEIGVIQPVKEISKIIRHFKKNTLGSHNSVYPLLHTDASQSIAYCDTSLHALGFDLLSCNAGKIYGPKGAGLLIIRKHVPIESIFFGGNQEFSIRPGTQALPLIAGFSQALEDVLSHKDRESERLREYKKYLYKFFVERYPEVIINGSQDESLSVPSILNISYPHIESDLLVIELDHKGFCVSSKTACKYDNPDESYVLQALRPEMNDSPEAYGTLRISFGRYTKKRDIVAFTKAFSDVVDKYQKFQSVLEK